LKEVKILNTFFYHQEKAKTKLSNNGHFYANPIFDKTNFFLVVTREKITEDTYLNFLPNVYTIILHNYMVSNQNCFRIM